MSYDPASTSEIQSQPKTVDEIRILIVDDQSFARKFLELVFESEAQSRLKVVGMASNGQEALQQLDTLQPNMAIIDLEMPGINGVSVIETIAQKYPDCKVLVFSSHDEEKYINDAIQAGAKGYLLKNTPGEELRNAIHSIDKGYYNVGPGLLQKAMVNSSNIVAATSEPDADLSLELEPEAETESNYLSNLADEGADSISIRENAENQQQWSGSTQELLNTLPQVWSRGLVYLLISFIAIGLPWIFLSRVDETGTARGKIEPKGKILKLDTAVSGQVVKVHAKEGEQIEIGQTLLTLESKVVTAQLQQEQEKLTGQKSQLQQLKSIEQQSLKALNTQNQQNQAETIEKQAQVEQAKQNATSLTGMYDSQKQEKQAELEQAQKAIKTSQATYELSQIRAKSALERVPRYRKAYQDGAISQDRLLETTQLAQEAQKELEKAQYELEQAQSSYREIQSSYQTLLGQETAEKEQAQLRTSEQEGSYSSLLHTNDLTLLEHEEKIEDAKTKIATLKGEIAQTVSKIESLKFQLTQYKIKAPTTGTIFDFSVQNKGSAVQSGDTIALIAPIDNTLYATAKNDLVIRAKMPSSETAFIRKGLPAKVKLDAYPFQDYGIVEGTVSWISPDSKVESERESSSRGEFFELEIALNQNYIEAEGDSVPLTPGQTATAEIVVRQRRLIDFFLDPFKKLQQGGVDL